MDWFFQNQNNKDDAPRSWMIPIALYAAVLHLLLLFWDRRSTESFLTADRAGQRIKKIQGFIESTGDPEALVSFLSSNGIIGDYIFHGLLYSSGGYLTVIFLHAIRFRVQSSF